MELSKKKATVLTIRLKWDERKAPIGVNTKMIGTTTAKHLQASISAPDDVIHCRQKSPRDE